MTIYPNSLDRARCRLCLERIAWVLTFPNRKRLPVDLPLEVHNLAYDADGHEIAELLSPTHFSTCPDYNAAAKPPPPSLHQQKLF